ncbi:MAG: thioredoxin domain-containing protein, partial [Chloroflexi bacterium]|nr:thioredoxin domain-containing protein [Chloroflexota bacterium]
MSIFRWLALIGLMGGLLIMPTGVGAQDQAEGTPTPVEDRYTDLFQAQIAPGFPFLGFPEAAVGVRLYMRFGDPASAAFHETVYPALLPRVAAGEVRLTMVPLFTETAIPGAEGAARAAICASDQNEFWGFQDLLFGWQREFGAAAFDGERLLSGVDVLGLNSVSWNQCLLSNRPDLTLESAQSESSLEINFTETPFVTVNGIPVLPDLPSLTAAIDEELSAAAARGA